MIINSEIGWVHAVWVPPRCAGREGWILSRGEQNWFFPFNVAGEDDDVGYDDGDDDNDDDNIKPGEQLFGRYHKWKYKDGEVILDLTHWK